MGAAFYQGNDVALFREPIAASDCDLARWLGLSGPATTLAVAHIRRATLGTVCLANTQPFVREPAGRSHVFAHNGHLPGIAQSAGLACERYRPIGDTDSEHALLRPAETPARLVGSHRDATFGRTAFRRGHAIRGRSAPLGVGQLPLCRCRGLVCHGHRRIHPASGQIEPPGSFRLAQSSSTVEQRAPAQGVTGEPVVQAVTWQPFAEGEVVVVAAGIVTQGGATC